VRIELILPWERTLSAREVFAASAARDKTPKLLYWLVDGVAVTTQVRLSCESLRAVWPVAADLPISSALLAVAE
jgi:hypothetical protein